ncbi:MAG: glycerophosphodiester phosphodiesterase family protein [Candidatus Saccharimonadales bacterium]
MTKRDIIGHRGAAGLALENTMASFYKVTELGVKTIEFDVHVTLDGHFVVCHDDSLVRVSESSASIKSLTLEELQQIPLHNGEYVPLLSEVLDLAREHRLAVIVEVKIREKLEELCELLDTYSDLTMTIASFKHDAIATMQKLRPDWRFYLAEGNHPIEALQKARTTKARGVDLNYKWLNPITYLLAKQWKLEIMVYTVNSPIVGKLIHFLYPDVAICTNYPNKFISSQRRVGRQS